MQPVIKNLMERPSTDNATQNPIEPNHQMQKPWIAVLKYVICGCIEYVFFGSGPVGHVDWTDWIL